MTSARIPLRRRDGTVRAWTLVDENDYENLKDQRWTLSSKGYARTRIRVDGQLKVAYMHRILAGLRHGDKRQVDHINREKLDNRRSNLRVVTPGQQQQNLPSFPGSSRYRGVYWSKAASKWVAQVQLKGKAHYLGLYVSEDAAAEAAAAFRAQHMPFSEDAA